MTDELITCSQCANEVPRLRFCVRCGHTLADEFHGETMRRKGAFAAQPDEPVSTIALVSTLFPQLPRADMQVFRLALLAGAAIMVGLALVGAFPLAVSTAAVLVPLLMVLYLWDVDVYEDEPRLVIGATMAWGALTGALAALVIRELPAATGPQGVDAAALVVAGVGVPLVTGLLMLIGPLALLPWRRFNDVLDGATFGGASAVAFVGAKLLVDSTSMWGGGLRPGGDPLQWAIKVVSLGILEPLIAAGVVGAICGAIWLRYRAPVSDRGRLGVAGQPPFAILGGAALMIGAGLARATLEPLAELVLLLVIAAMALTWLRSVIHLGLMQEAHEVSIGPALGCPNCGEQTPHHTFCGNCGISLAALPRRARPHSTPAIEPAQPETSKP